MREFLEGERRRRVLCGALGLSLLVLGASASGRVVPRESAMQVVGQVVVRFRDLDVRQPKDASKLYQRLRYAAREACRDGGSRDLAARSEERRCELAALERAVRSIDKPLVTATHQRMLAKRGSKPA